MGKRKDLRVFGRDMKILAEAHEKMSEAQVRRVAILTGSTVIEETPVDTGRARANWHASLNKPDTRNTYMKARAPSSVEWIHAESTLIRVANSFKAGDKILITNNLPYINRLNNGWSMQKPVPGWIERTAITAFKALVKKWRRT